MNTRLQHRLIVALALVLVLALMLTFVFISGEALTASALQRRFVIAVTLALTLTLTLALVLAFVIGGTLTTHIVGEPLITQTPQYRLMMALALILAFAFAFAVGGVFVATLRLGLEERAAQEHSIGVFLDRREFSPTVQYSK